ncbi:Ketose-bisphosphate aldolase [[Clostridium] ultunense Esp]|nr:Ketose-bisphosphate aldolase [[Clostridium] ultunense Esp]
MLLPLNSILNEANKHNYAVIAVNVFNYETIRAAIEAAWEERSPIILNFGESIGEITDIYDFVAIAKIVESRYDIPVCINLDHSFKYDECIKAIRAGFTSIMVDRSSEPYETNVEETCELVKVAHSVGVSVEAELGHVGLGEEYGEEVENSLTNPDIAADFVDKTNVDALAVAIGTAHGLYKGTPKIDFDRLVEIKKRVNMPLVLHGGSMTGDEKLRKASQLGINKINIGTDVDIAAMEGFKSQEAKPGWELPIRMDLAREAMKKKIRHYIRIFGSSDKA